MVMFVISSAMIIITAIVVVVVQGPNLGAQTSDLGVGWSRFRLRLWPLPLLGRVALRALARQRRMHPPPALHWPGCLLSEAPQLYKHVNTYRHTWYMYIFTHGYVHAYVHTHIHACIHTYARAHTHTHTHTQIQVYMCVCVYPHTYICIHACMFSWIYMYLYLF